jgi:hypothetical protein
MIRLHRHAGTQRQRVWLSREKSRPLVSLLKNLRGLWKGEGNLPAGRAELEMREMWGGPDRDLKCSH